MGSKGVILSYQFGSFYFLFFLSFSEQLQHVPMFFIYFLQSLKQFYGMSIIIFVVRISILCLSY